MASGRRWRGIQGDSSQLGAGLIVDPDGIVRPAHRSHDPAHRPAVDNLLTTLTSLQPWTASE
jgi:hypothetical protein